MGAASSQTADRHGVRLQARISATQKALLQRAAALAGCTLGEFVVASAQEAASKVIQDHAATQLSHSAQVAFVTALLDPPKPSARLRRAAAAYRQQPGCDCLTHATAGSTCSASMPIKPIRTDEDLRAAFRRLESIYQADEGTLESDERDLLVTLVEAYEKQHSAFGPADTVEAIKFRMEQQGLTAHDLEPYIGSSERVLEVLNRKRPLSLRMVKRLHEGLHIPYESLLAGT